MTVFFGDYDELKAGQPEKYHADRFTTLDFRGPLQISTLSIWGFYNQVITLSHPIRFGKFEARTKPGPVIVEDYAFVTSYCILYDCVIKTHAIVSIGSVVSRMVVPAHTIVAGNPARVVAEWNGSKWIKVKQRRW